MKLRFEGSSHPELNHQGFTLVEVLVAVSLLTVVASGTLWALTQANNYAALSRLYTGAQVAAQNQIDLLMSKGPFNPQTTNPDGSPVLNPDGTLKYVPDVLRPTASPSPLGRDNIPLTETVTIYSEPNSQVANPLTVTGQRVTTVMTDNPPKVLNGRTLYIYYATVVVTFSYRGVPHQVQLNAMRASDAEGV